MNADTQAPSEQQQSVPAFGPRPIGNVNWIGLWNLYLKEVHRFLNVFVQTVASPMVTALLFLAVFALALGRAVETVGGVSFIQFICPGLIIMTMAQNSFANCSSSVVISKVQGNIVDVLMPPLSPFEFVTGYILAGITRGAMVGISCYIGIIIFVDLPLHSFWLLIAFSILGTMMLSLLGFLGGVVSEKFDHMAAITNFVITPFAFLSGTFYSVERLPEPFYAIAHFNPFFYMIDGFRGAFLGWSDSPAEKGLLVLIIVNSVLFALSWLLVKRGYKLKN